jgi:hypothetical protein
MDVMVQGTCKGQRGSSQAGLLQLGVVVGSAAAVRDRTKTLSGEVVLSHCLWRSGLTSTLLREVVIEVAGCYALCATTANGSSGFCAWRWSVVCCSTQSGFAQGDTVCWYVGLEFRLARSNSLDMCLVWMGEFA